MRFRIFFKLKKFRKHITQMRSRRNVLSLKKKNGGVAPHRISEWGCSNKLLFPESRYPNIQISKYPDIQKSRYPDIKYQIPDIRYRASGMKKIHVDIRKRMCFPKNKK